MYTFYKILPTINILDPIFFIVRCSTIYDHLREFVEYTHDLPYLA
jgi:hypothetical protein